MWELDCEESWAPAKELMLLNCGAGEDSWPSLGRQGNPTSPFWKKSVLNTHWKDWCWSWNSNTLGSWCEELTHWKRPWCLERLKAGREGDDRRWDGWMAPPTQWTWVWVNSNSCWRWIGRPGVLQSMGLQGVGHNWVTELNWMGLDAMMLVFRMLSFKPVFQSSLLPLSRGSLVPLLFLPLGWCHLRIWGYWYFSWWSWFQLVLHPACASSSLFFIQPSISHDVLCIQVE